MTKTELRAEVRIPVTRRGTLNIEGDWFPCMVLDMSDSGFLIMSTKPLEAGQALDFRSELFPGKVLECKIEVRHVGEAGAGTKITEIDDKGHTLVQLFLQEHYSSRLDRTA